MENLPDIDEHHSDLHLTTKVEKSVRAPAKATSTSYFKHHKATVECLEEGARKWKRLSNQDQASTGSKLL